MNPISLRLVPRLLLSSLILITLIIIPIQSLSTAANQQLRSLQTITKEPQWICNSQQSTDIYTHTNCELSPGCTLRGVKCTIYNETTSTYDISLNEQPCIDIQSKPIRIKDTCSELLACASLQCSEHSECIFDATNIIQPWYCQCHDGFTGDQCDLCYGTKSERIPTMDIECNQHGIIGTYHITQTTEACGCLCTSMRSKSIYNVPIYNGNKCQCVNTFISITYPTISLEQYESHIDQSYNEHIQLLTKLIIEDMNLNQTAIILNTTTTPSGQLPSFQNTSIALYPSTNNIITPTLNEFNVSFAIQYCPLQSQQRSFQLQQQQQYQFTSLQTTTDPDSLSTLLQQYESNPNSIIYNPTLFPTVPKLSLYIPSIPTDSTEPIEDDPNSPFNEIPTHNDKQRPKTWAYSRASWISGLVLIVFCCAAYITGHCMILRIFHKRYEPKDTQEKLVTYKRQYEQQFLSHKKQYESQVLGDFRHRSYSFAPSEFSMLDHFQAPALSFVAAANPAYPPNYTAQQYQQRQQNAFNDVLLSRPNHNNRNQIFQNNHQHQQQQLSPQSANGFGFQNNNNHQQHRRRNSTNNHNYQQEQHAQTPQPYQQQSPHHYSLSDFHLQSSSPQHQSFNQQQQQQQQFQISQQIQQPQQRSAPPTPIEYQHQAYQLFQQQQQQQQLSNQPYQPNNNIRRFSLQNDNPSIQSQNINNSANINNSTYNLDQQPNSNTNSPLEQPQPNFLPQPDQPLQLDSSPNSTSAHLPGTPRRSLQRSPSSSPVGRI